MSDPIEAGGVGGSYSPDSIASSLIGVQFYLGFGTRSFPSFPVHYVSGTFDGTIGKIDESLLENMIGGNLRLVAGQLGVFQFDASNTRAFDYVAQQLTDGVDNPSMASGAFGFNADRMLVAGAGQGASESVLLNTPTGRDLTGSEIDFIRLTVTDLELGPPPSNPGDRYRFSARAYWEIYGSPSPVPEPSTLLLLLLGFGLTAIARITLPYRTLSNGWRSLRVIVSF